MATTGLIEGISEVTAIEKYSWTVVTLNLIAATGILEDGGERLVINN